MDPASARPGETERRQQLPRQGVQARGRMMLMGAAAAVLVLAGVAGVSLTRHADGPHVGITTSTGLGQPYGASFLAADSQLTDQQWKERSDAFAAFAAKGPVLLDRIEAGQALPYIGKTVPDPAKQQQLAADIQTDKVEMAAIGLFDDCAEDGDVVRVQAGDIDLVVPLLHQIQYVQVPVPKGQIVQVTVMGVKDGTGGITLGMVSPRGTVHMPRLEPGQQVSFQAQ